MSETDPSSLSVLLPAATVAVYSKDQDTLSAAKGLVDDWRFARVVVQDDESDVEEAIKVYGEIESPDLIVIQTDTIDEAFTGRLEALAAQCGEGTSAIIVGPDNDVNLYRRLIDMGVSDYLVRPVSVENLANVIGRALIEKKGVTGSRLIAVAGAKGGVGASMIAQALACGLADIAQQKTLLMDTAGGWSSLGVGLGFEPSTTLSEAVRAAADNNSDNIARMLHSVSERLKVLATGGDVMLEDDVSADQLEGLLDLMMVTYPVVVVDLSQSSSALQKAVLSRASQILVVSTPTLSALRMGRSLIQEVREVRGGEDDAIDLIINMHGHASANEVSKADIEKAMEFKVSAYLPYDAKVFLGSENESRKLTEDKAARALIETVLLPVVQKAVKPEEGDGEGVKSGGMMSGLLGKLKAK